MSLFTTQEVNGDYRVFFINSYSAVARKVICGVSEYCYQTQSLLGYFWWVPSGTEQYHNFIKWGLTSTDWQCSYVTCSSS